MSMITEDKSIIELLNLLHVCLLKEMGHSMVTNMVCISKLGFANEL